MPADRLPAALSDLDPGNRALLDLSLRRGVSDAEIGELLRKDPDDVARARNAVLGLLAERLEVSGEGRRERVRQAILALPDEAWRPAVAAFAEGPGPDDGDAAPVERGAGANGRAREKDEAPPQGEAHDDRTARAASTPRSGDGSSDSREAGLLAAPPGSRTPRSGWLLASLGLVLVVGSLVALLVAGGDGDDDPATPGAERQERPAPREAATRATLRRLGQGRDGGGRASLRPDGRLVISVRGLPDPAGHYTAWLYSSVVEAIPLGKFPSGTGRLEVRAPARASRYRFLDISREPADGNRNHSGESVLRAPLEKLLAR